MRDVVFDQNGGGEGIPTLNSLPIEEYENLRTADLGMLPVSGRQLDITASFQLPTDDANIVGIKVFESDDGNTFTLISIEASSEKDYYSLKIDTSKSGFNVPNKNNSFPVSEMQFYAEEATEATVDLRVVVDRSLVEAFAMGGRAVVTSTVYANAEHSKASIVGDTNDSNAWEMGCGWL